jgi:3-(3-hydroxy-phenyl)propionate hydroxylase
MTRATVAVVGAGPTGVAAAILLADRGVDVVVLDRWTEVYPRPRAVALDDEVHRILARMGLTSEFAAISRPARGLRLIDSGDRAVLAEFGRAIDGVHGFPESSLFDQPELERMLRAALARRPAARFRGDVEVTGLVRHALGDGAVTVELGDRTTGEADTVVADWVLGCDGANSVVRDAIGARTTDLGFAQRWLVVDVATRADLGQWEGIHQVCSPERAATFMRIGEDRYRWEFRLRDGESAADFPTAATVRPLLRPWLRGTPDDELEIVRVTDYTFRARIADRWRDGRVFLLGDAAHLTPPFIGQGMGAGVRDAANLAWKLAAVVHGERPESDLDSYPAERRPHTMAMIRKAVVLGRVMTGGGRAGTALRRAVAPRLRRVGRRLSDSATPALRRSALVHAPAVHRGLAGTLCPNAPIGGTRFDDRADGRFALVTDVPCGPGRRRTAERAGIGVVEVGADDQLGRWLADGGAHAALVRPDGTVLAASSTPDGALARLGRDGAR